MTWCRGITKCSIIHSSIYSHCTVIMTWLDKIYTKLQGIFPGIAKMSHFSPVSPTGWPRKNATLSFNNFKKTRDRMKNLCALLRIEFFFEQDDTKIVNFDEGVWFCGRFSEAMSFSRFALLSQKSQFTYRIFSIVWLPLVNCQLLLCKAKPAWIIKRSIHYVTLQHYNPGELLKEIPPYLKRDYWYKRSKFWKLHCLS